MSLQVLTTYLCILLAAASGCFYGAWRKKAACEEYFPLTLFFIILVMYLGGMIRQLTLTAYLLMAAAAVVSLGSLVWMICRDGFSSIKRLLTPGMILYFLLFAFLAFTQYKMVSREPDEASHWMDVIRAMKQTDTFGVVPEARCYFGNYPPALSLMEYFAIAIGGLLTGQPMEQLAFLIFHLLALSLYMPFAAQFRKNRGIAAVLAAMAFFTIPWLFGGTFFYSLSVDSMVGLLAGFCFAYPLLGLEAAHRKVTYLLALFVLCLSKANGVAFAAAAALTHGILGWLCRKAGGPDTPKAGTTPKTALLAAGVLFASWLSWQLLIAVNRPLFSEPWSEPIVLERFLQRFGIIRRFLAHLFTCQISFGFVQLPVICFVPLLLMGIWVTAGKLSQLNTGMRRHVFVSALSVLVAVYMAGLCLSYLLLFSEKEANALGSVERYSSTLWQMLTFILFSLALQWLSQTETNDQKRRMTILFVIMLLIFPYNYFSHTFISGKSVDDAHAKRDHYDVVAAQVLDAIPQESAEIFLVTQQTKNRDDFWFLRSLVRPHRIDNHNFNLTPAGELDQENGISCITKASEEEFLGVRISSQRWQEMLRESYDYVLLYHLSEWFVKDYGALFEEPETIGEYSLYQVLDDGTLRHVPFE